MLFLMEDVQETFLSQKGGFEPKALAFIPFLLLRLFSFLVAGSKFGFDLVLGNIALTIIVLYSSATAADNNVRGSKSFIVTCGRSSSDRIIRPGASDAGLSRFRGETGDGSRFRFSGGDSGDEAEAVGAAECPVEDVEVEDLFEVEMKVDGSDSVGIA